jgi:hypothetical protein
MCATGAVGAHHRWLESERSSALERSILALVMPSHKRHFARGRSNPRSAALIAAPSFLRVTGAADNSLVCGSQSCGLYQPAGARAVPGRTETGFPPLDKRNRIGYNSIVKLGERSGPCGEHYAAMLLFPVPYSLFPVPYCASRPPGNTMLPCYRPPRPNHENVPSGTKSPQIGPPRDGHKVCRPTGSKKEFFKNERTTRECL